MSLYSDVNIGVVGYSSGKFDQAKAKILVDVGLSYLTKPKSENDPPVNYRIVSGLTDIGIPALAYRWAKDHSYQTVGIACEKAKDYDLYPVEEKIITGKDWGDESSTFLKHCNAMLRVGGGEQSLKEIAQFKKDNPDSAVLELELAREK